MKIDGLKKELKKIAKEFGLKYNPFWFNVIWISKRHARYLEYVGMCFDPIYTRFGKTIEKRIGNIEKFEFSKEFKKIKNEFSGQAITKIEVLEGIKNCKKIKDLKLRNELLNLHNKIKLNLKQGSLALLTKTNNKKQKEILLNSILLHEWIHHLLIKNKIYFKSISEKYWKYDEGLVTYLEYYVKNKLNYLESIKSKIKYPSQKIYFIYAMRFRELFKDKKIPAERKKVLLSLLKKIINPATSPKQPTHSKETTTTSILKPSFIIFVAHPFKNN